MIHFELVFMYGVSFKLKFIIFWLTVIQLFQERQDYPSIHCLCALVKSQLGTFVCLCFCFHSVSLIPVSRFRRDCCSHLAGLQIGWIDSFHFPLVKFAFAFPHTFYLLTDLFDVQYYINFRCAIWRFTTFKGYILFIVTIKYWLYLLCCTLYPCRLLFYTWWWPPKRKYVSIFVSVCIHPHT